LPSYNIIIPPKVVLTLGDFSQNLILLLNQNPIISQNPIIFHIQLRTSVRKVIIKSKVENNRAAKYYGKKHQKFIEQINSKEMQQKSKYRVSTGTK